MKKSILKIFIVFTLLGFTVARGQNNYSSYEFDSVKTYIVKLNDGSDFLCNFISKDSVSVTVGSKSVSKIEIPFEMIKSIDVVDPENIKRGSYWFPNPNGTRYILSQSAFNLKKGEGYYKNTQLLLNSFNLGITNNISVGGGIELLSTISSFSSDVKPIFYLTSKVGFKVSKKINLAGNVIWVSGSDYDDNAALITGMGTYGNLNHNLTAGIGLGFIEGEILEKPTISLSGMTRISKRIALITENWSIPYNNSNFPSNEYHNFYSYGIRFLGKKLSVDVAFIYNKEMVEDTGLVIGVPVVDFVVKF